MASCAGAYTAPDGGTIRVKTTDNRVDVIRKTPDGKTEHLRIEFSEYAPEISSSVWTQLNDNSGVLP